MLRQGKRGAGFNAIDRGHPCHYRGFTLFHWHRPAYGMTLVGSAVSNHADQGGLGIDMIQASTTLRPLFDATALNGRPGITYDGVDDLMDSASFTSVPQPVTRFFAFKLTVGSSVGHMMDGTTAGALHGAYKPNNTQLGMYASAELRGSFVGNTAAHVMMNQYNGATSVLGLDGVTIASGNAGTQAISRLRYGSQQGGGDPFGGVIGESVAYKSVMPASVQRRIVRRLGAISGAAIA